MVNESKLVITRYGEGILSCILKNNRMVQANFTPEGASIVGNIYIAKVLNVVPSLHAAFLEYAPGKKCYLPILKNEVPQALNRTLENGKLSSGDLMLVQIIKDAIKTKEPMATSNISFTGQYCVVTSGNKRIGFSDKLPKALKEKMRPFLPKTHDYGIIIRTNAGELLEQDRMEDVQAQIHELSKEMYALMEAAPHRTCYSVLHEAPPAFLSDIRDAYHFLYEKIVTDDEAIYQQIQAYLQNTMPDELPKLSLYQDKSYSMHKLYSLDTKLKEALSPKVWLKSGAYLVIQPTEALIAIDVNSGKNDSKKISEEYILEINREAAVEIVAQMKLRNLSGMILIDFINMPEKYHEEFLLYLTKLCKQDQVPTHVYDMTALGLVEVTRKKIRKSLWEQMHYETK